MAQLSASLRRREDWLAAAEMKMTELKLYAKPLKSHPGVPVAASMMFLGFVAGARGDNWFYRGLIGAAIMSIFWIPVLCTAWINRKNA